MLRTSLLFTIMLCAGAAAAAEREYIYGAELMTPREREAYRRDLDAAASDDARERFRERHRERLRERARERGATLDDRGIVERRGSGSRARDAEGTR